MARSEYLAVVEQYGRGAYGAYVPDLPGIGVAGETEAEVRALVTDAIRLYLDELGQGESPTKHIRPDRALLGIGADILAGLAKPMTVSGLWDHLRLRRTASKSNAVLDYRWFVLALDFLYLIGAIDFERGVIRKASR